MTSEDNRVPIAVYDNCKSFTDPDFKTIETFCYLANFSQKQFKFNLPTTLDQGLPPHEALVNIVSKVYQYGANDFELGLFDQVGEKNYTVSLWQLPQ